MTGTVEYDSRYGHAPQPHAQSSPMVVDRSHLVRRRSLRRNADRLRHARGRHAPHWGRLFIYLDYRMVAMGACNADLLRLGRRYPPVQWKPISTWVRHLVACIAIGFTFSVWTATLRKITEPMGQTSRPRAISTTSVAIRSTTASLATFILYAAILVGRHVLDSRERLAIQQTETARLNEQLSRRSSALFAARSSRTSSSTRSTPSPASSAKRETTQP